MPPNEIAAIGSKYGTAAQCAYNPATRPVQRFVWMDAFFRNLTRFFAFVVFSILAAILISLVVHSQSALSKYGFNFLLDPEWDPVAEQFGALVPIYGTLVSSAIALIIGIPVSFGIALFLTELSPAWLKRPLGTAIEMLAAIPSIIYGMWGLFVFAPLFAEYVQPALIRIFGPLPILGPLFKGPAMGIGMLTAGIILAVMVIPFITAVMRDVFELVPPMLKESAYGLGATTWEVVWRIVLPYTKIGVVGGVMLGLGRALGETLAVVILLSGLNSTAGWSWSIFNGGSTFASKIAGGASEFDSPQKTGAYIAAGLVLFVLTFAVNAVARIVIERRKAFTE